jgi:hypothetical protein
MKTLIPALLGALLLIAPGCQTTQMTLTQKLALARSVATEAAFVGASYDRASGPANRARYAVAVAALDVFIARDEYDPLKLQEALQGLPALRGANGAILEAGVGLYSIAAGFVELDSAPVVQAVMLGARDGLNRALARPVSNAARSIAPALPKQCEIPPR